MSHKKKFKTSWNIRMTNFKRLFNNGYHYNRQNLGMKKLKTGAEYVHQRLNCADENLFMDSGSAMENEASQHYNRMEEPEFINRAVHLTLNFCRLIGLMLLTLSLTYLCQFLWPRWWSLEAGMFVNGLYGHIVSKL